MTDFAAARRNMVDGQVRTADVTDLRIISAMMEVPRERFVPPGSAAIAYLDLDLPVGDGQGARRLLKPMVLAKLIQAADVPATGRVLCVGCAGGYSAAVLSRIAGEVVALEQNADLAAAAGAALAPMTNVSVVTGPFSAGWPKAGPYDVVVLEGAVEVEPVTFTAQLAEGGRLVCVMGSPPGGKAMLFYRSGNELSGRPIFDAAASVLPGFAKPPVFAF